MKIDRVCRYCGAAFQTDHWRLRAGRGSYCSPRCRARIAPLAERFWAQVRKTRTCWLWTGTVAHNGYGTMGILGIVRMPHRIAYELTHGPIPPGMLVCHSCDNRLCVRPAHLWLGTHAANNGDMARKGRAANGERNSGAKLTAAKVRAIRAAYTGKRGEQIALARRYGVSHYSISRIVHRTSWR